MKLVFYPYILQQEENSLLYRFLMAQKEEPRRGDWYSEVQQILKEFEITNTENEIQSIPPNIFKNLVKKKVLLAGIRYLKIKQNKCEQGPKRHKPWLIQKFKECHEKVMRKS